MGPDAMIFLLWMLSFKPTFSLSFILISLSLSFTFIKRLFSSSSLSAIRVASSAYLRLLILMAILIPAYTLFSLAFHMMYSACKLNNKQGDNMQPWHTPFPIWNQSVVSCPVLTDPGPVETRRLIMLTSSLHPIRTMSMGWSHVSPWTL